jgi:carbonic anhydrase
MRLLEAILDVNARRASGDASARLGATLDASLPLAALTCIDPRLNPLLPGMLGIPDDRFVWLRNAGNIITGPLSSTMRSLAMACAIKGAREIAVIGHTDCQVGKTSVSELVDRLAEFGVERDSLPEDLAGFFGLFELPHENVRQSMAIVRMSPLIGRHVPVHGLVIDVVTGRLECVENGYDAVRPAGARPLGAPR